MNHYTSGSTHASRVNAAGNSRTHVLFSVFPSTIPEWKEILLVVWTLYDLGATSLRPQGGTRSIHDGGGPTYFFGLKIYTLGIFLGQEICHVFFKVLKKCVFFWVLSPSERFVSGFRCGQWIRKIFIRTFFQRRVFRVLIFLGVGNFDARYFFGYKISGFFIFLGLQYEAPSDPRVMYTSSTPPGSQTFSLLSCSSR